ncbi:unnamed protein product [Sphagnum jensenii]|uniref:RING-type domain-containing protein n=1 Tax=Sphagnum jensenii TaxID=128206 RepID=A0ABP1B5H9_9BRYO
MGLSNKMMMIFMLLPPMLILQLLLFLQAVLRIWTQSLIKLALKGQEMGKEMWSHVQYAWKHGRALGGICSLACGHLFGKSCIKRWLRHAGKKQGKCPQCNCRAKVEDLRMVYVPRIAIIDGEGQHTMQISELMEEIRHSQALLSVLYPEQHNAFNAFQWTLQRTPESLKTLHQPIHPIIIHVPPSHQVAQENHRQFPTSIGQADLKNCRKYQLHRL